MNTAERYLYRAIGLGLTTWAVIAEAQIAVATDSRMEWAVSMGFIGLIGIALLRLSYARDRRN